MIKKLEEKNSDKKDWDDYINSPSQIFDKENPESGKSKTSRKYRFDFHGYTIENANKKIKELISKCYEDGTSEILVITGKGKHSNQDDNVYASKEFGLLQNTLPEFIKNNEELKSKIKKVIKAPKEYGGEGAIIIKLKRL